MKINIDYGRTGLDIDVPDRNLRAVLGLRPAPSIMDPEDAIRQRLTTPIGGLPLARIAGGRKSACVLICDITRPVPNSTILPPVLRTLLAAGIPQDKIRILVATGLHRAATNRELVEMLGPDIANGYLVESHDARDAESHDNLGFTRSGVPVFVDRRYRQADLKITTGLVEPHLMAGFSGGRKVICPGIVGVETLKRFHGVGILQSPLATAGVVDGNPIHELSTEVARMAGCDFIVNVALDDERRITGVFAGDMEQAWMTGVQHVRSIAEAPLSEPVDILITSAAGYPLDITFYQSVKGLVGALPAVRKGGTVLMAASLMEGVGSPEFKTLLEAHSTIGALQEQIETAGFFAIDQWQAQELARVLEHARVVVYSDQIGPAELAKLHVTPAASPEAAIADAIRQYGPDASIAVMPRGPYVLPRVESGLAIGQKGAFAV
jgi:lactate racemase